MSYGTNLAISIANLKVLKKDKKANNFGKTKT